MKPEDFKTFIGTYHYAGSEYSFEIKAEDWTDALGRIMAIRATAVVAGELGVKIHYAIPASRWLARAWCWLGNLRRVPR